MSGKCLLVKLGIASLSRPLSIAEFFSSLFSRFINLGLRITMVWVFSVIIADICDS